MISFYHPLPSKHVYVAKDISDDIRKKYETPTKLRLGEVVFINGQPVKFTVEKLLSDGMVSLLSVNNFALKGKEDGFFSNSKIDATGQIQITRLEVHFLILIREKVQVAEYCYGSIPICDHSNNLSDKK